MIEGENNLLFSVYGDANVEDPALGQMSNILEALFICNNINTNLNKNFRT